MTVPRPDIEPLVAALKAAGTRGDDAIDLADTALLLGALDRPAPQLARYRAHLATLTDEVRRSIAGLPDLSAALVRVNNVVFFQHGYHGDETTYGDPRNANLLDVIDRKKGLPVALAIVFLHAARAAGWTVRGLNFPNHFLVRVEDGDARLIVDPFHRGARLGPTELRGLAKALFGLDTELRPEFFEEVSDRAILLRLQNNLKTRALAAGMIDRAYEVLTRQMWIAPDVPDLWHEAGVLEAKRGNIRAAIQALETHLGRVDITDIDGRTASQHLLAELRGRLN